MVSGASSGTNGTAVASSISSYVAYCRRERDLNKDDPNSPLFASANDGGSDRQSSDDEEAVGTIGDSAGASAGGPVRKNAEESMEQCIALLAPHLAAFREKCLTAPGIATGGKNSRSASVGDEIPPQLLRVARFFRWRWGPLKRALLRPAEAPSSSGSTGDVSNAIDGSVVEVGSIRLRLRLARALHSRGLLSLAEVDVLAASIDRGDVHDDGMDASPSKKRKLNSDGSPVENSSGLLTSRIRLALSRLPSDVNVRSDSSGVRSGVKSDKAKRGIRYAEAVLAEWVEERQKRNKTGGTNNVSASSDCPSPQDLADWCLTTFTAVVLANGVDYKKYSSSGGSKQQKQGGVAHFKADGGNVELSLASIMLEETTELGLAIEGKIRAFLSPQLIDDLNEIHLLSLARLLCHARQVRHRDLVIDYFAGSAILCSHQSGGVGMQHLPKIIASYLSLAVDVPDESISIPAFEESIRASIKRRGNDDANRQKFADTKQSLLFCDVIFHAVRFFLSC